MVAMLAEGFDCSWTCMQTTCLAAEAHGVHTCCGMILWHVCIISHQHHVLKLTTMRSSRRCSGHDSMCALTSLAVRRGRSIRVLLACIIQHAWSTLSRPRARRCSLSLSLSQTPLPPSSDDMRRREASLLRRSSCARGPLSSPLRASCPARTNLLVQSLPYEQYGAEQATRLVHPSSAVITTISTAREFSL